MNLNKCSAIILVFGLGFSGLALSSPVESADPPPAGQAAETNEKHFVFDPAVFRWFAYENGDLVGSGNASGGNDFCKDIGQGCRTPEGTFYVKEKRGKGCQSTQFPIRKNGKRGGAPMPYCMFFQGGYAVHGSNDVPEANVSHGCVRVENEDAEWLSKEFIEIGTKIIIKPYAT